LDASWLWVYPETRRKSQQQIFINPFSADLTDHIKWDVQDFQLSCDGKWIAFITNEDGLSVLHLLDAASGKERPASKLPAGVAGGIQWHRSNREIGLTATSARNPAEAYALDVESGKAERWTYSEAGGINTQSYSEPAIVRWKSFDGTLMSGWLYQPPAKFAGKRPVILDILGRSIRLTTKNAQSGLLFVNRLNTIAYERKLTMRNI
jgi:dipeptidyl aminopeptidase/acylaminoacyl peptidase